MDDDDGVCVCVCVCVCVENNQIVVKNFSKKKYNEIRITQMPAK